MTKEDVIVKLILEKVEKISDSLDNVKADISDMKQVNIKQEENLRLHMYRTELAEKSIDMLREDILPIKRDRTIFWGIVKILGGLSVITGTIVAVIEIINNFK